MAESLILIFSCAVIAFSLSAVCGGGAGLILMPLLGLYLPASRLPSALSIGTTFSSASRVVLFFGNIRWNIVKWFVPAALPAVILGAVLLRFINPIYLEVIMGLFLVGNLPSLLRQPTKETSNMGSSILLLVIGFLAGFLSGLTGAVGLLFNRFYLRYGLSKEQIVATRAANEILLHIVKLVLYAFFGLLTGKVIVIGITIAVAGIVSSWVMKRGLRFISDGLFRKVGYAAMVVSGIAMLGQSISAVFVQNNASITWTPIASGVESKLQWQNSNLAIEFEYNEGFEYEQEINLADLPGEKQAYVLDQKDNSDRIVVEEVFGIGSHSYEAYYYSNGRLTNKIAFD
jgi:uncharacterized membrane protein YfcA